MHSVGSTCPGPCRPSPTDAAFRAWLRSLYRQTLGRLCEAALWQPGARPPLPARGTPTVSPFPITGSSTSRPGRRLVSVERLSPRQSRSGRSRSTSDEFLRRFLLHVLPKRFVRIRYLWLLSPRARAPATWPSVVRPSPSPRRRPRNRPPRRAPRVVAVSALWRAHAPRRTADRAATPSRPPSSPTSSMTPRSAAPRSARRPTSRSYARAPEVCPRAGDRGPAITAATTAPARRRAAPIVARTSPRHARTSGVPTIESTIAERAASAANASGLVQTALSKVTRRSASEPTRACVRRVTPDRVLPLGRSYLVDHDVASWNHVTNWLRKVEALLQLLSTRRGEPIELGVSIVLARPARAGVGFVPV